LKALASSTKKTYDDNLIEKKIVLLCNAMQAMKITSKEWYWRGRGGIWQGTNQIDMFREKYAIYADHVLEKKKRKKKLDGTFF
jgi:hypothetical protein